MMGRDISRELIKRCRSAFRRRIQSITLAPWVPALANHFGATFRAFTVSTATTLSLGNYTTASRILALLNLLSHH